MDNDSWVKKCREIVVGHRGRPGKLGMMLAILVLNVCDLDQDRVNWKFAVK